VSDLNKAFELSYSHMSQTGANEPISDLLVRLQNEFELEGEGPSASEKPQHVSFKTPIPLNNSKQARRVNQEAHH
jgi:hypothetical protein